jgi:serine/threonine protein kinase
MQPGLDEMEAREIIYQILKGMVAIHEKGYVHRDLKPENILMDEKNKIYKIADFGLAKK